MEKLKRMALMALLVAGSVTMAFADTTALDTVGTGYSSTDGVLMIDIHGKNLTLLSRNSTVDQTVAGAQAVRTYDFGYGDGGYLRYTAHGYTKSLKILVESQTVGLISQAVVVRVQSTKAEGSLPATLGTIQGGFIGIQTVPQEFVVSISGNDTWTGTGDTSGHFLQYRAQENPGVSSLSVVYSIMEQ